MKKQSLGNYKSIRDYLKRTGKTEAELGKLAGSSQSHVNKLKNGIRRPTPEVAARLEAITGISLRILLFKVEKKHEPGNPVCRCRDKHAERTDCMEKIS